MARKPLRKIVRPKRVYKTKSKGTTNVSKAVKKYVKRTLHTQIENKELNIDSGANFGNYLNDNTLGAYPMMPLVGYWTVSQNVNAAGRVGNQISIRKVMLSYVLRPMPYNGTTNPVGRPCEVEMFLGYVKRTPSVRPTATDFQNLFQAGNTANPPTGDLNDINANINSDYWCVKKRWRAKIGYSSTASSVSSAGTTAQRPATPLAGEIRFNTTTLSYEGYSAGIEGQPISGISNVTVTATLTTTLPHGLSTGAYVVVSGASPAAYNGSFTITVTSETEFTYVMGSDPGGNASAVGSYTYGAWSGIGGGATGGGSDEVFVENTTVVTTSYAIPTGRNAESVGPITINASRTVTIPSGQRWVIL